jgi:hypothetical protein
MAGTLIDDEYRAGYIAGFRSARKDDVAEPDVPATPFIREGQTARDVGWHHGRLHGLDATVPDDPQEAK